MMTRRFLRWLPALVALLAGVIGCQALQNCCSLAQDSFSRVKVGMMEHEVGEALKGEDPEAEAENEAKCEEYWRKRVVAGFYGRSFSPPGWPTRLGQLPEYEKGPCAANEIHWSYWRVRDAHRWVAVGIAVNNICGGSLTAPVVVIKKSGLGGPDLPPGCSYPSARNPAASATQGE
jgi:hypothetical protein